MIITTKLFCKGCNRFLATAMGSVDISELICARCKKRNSFKIVTKKKKETDNG